MKMPHATGAATEESMEDAKIYEAVGGDWGDIAKDAEELGEEHIVVNLGPVHPSTHGVLRVQVELDGERVNEVRAATGFLHTGIEKNMEYRTWTQGVAFCTRMDYVAPIFQEVAYCMAIEKLLGIEDQIPERAKAIRVLLMELTRINSHIVGIGSGGNELGATTMLTLTFRLREDLLRIMEDITGLRMNNEFIRPGGVLEDLPEGGIDYIRELLPGVRNTISEMQDLTMANPIFLKRHVDVAVSPLSALMALSMTGPSIRAAGLPWDLRKTQPYCGYEKYEFDVPVADKCDAYNRIKVKFEECYQSLRIIYQVLDELEQTAGEPVMISDKKIAWPAQLSIAQDGQGTDPAHVREIMTESMESLIHHFKLVTEGFRVPAGQAYATVEHAKGVMGVHLVSDGGTRPYRAHFRDPGFNNLQSLALMAEGGLLADLIIALAAVDPVMGGVDR
ncbi:NADH-quinone oxidoreductase subunit D [Trueperella pyogenes]|uniref:NADH-quinone oxidoreductase subunit D n=2 Tax=Trueperella pyogenes TaxID=1661 RepID=X4RBR3_9ACTO|nr:NADH dehydrogenase [Trueperella pyogenes]AJC70009.1 NADH dehydrogenase subunit D [Trueperella pyogenes TP8]ALD73144.1 NADH dehydrogenase [Trueperella pyogenes]AZQ99937.1 NADH-quinone oxidoreductase subunit D [Trueperella pyogenes]AZR02974.1 NADH-quinone oxidoreductase subunit D [Trueperella pyogenes]